MQLQQEDNYFASLELITVTAWQCDAWLNLCCYPPNGRNRINLTFVGSKQFRDSTILQQQQSETCLHPLKERRLKLKISLFRNDKLCREIGILLDAKLCGTQTREGEYLNMSNSTQLHMKNLPVSNLDVKLILVRADVIFDQT